MSSPHTQAHTPYLVYLVPKANLRDVNVCNNIKAKPHGNTYLETHYVHTPPTHI